MKQLAILKDKGKGNHGGTNPLVKENILLLTEKRLSEYENDVPFLTALDVPQTVEQLTVASATETSNLTYYATAENFPAGNKFYAATPKTVTLDVGDATFGRVDLILANRPDVVDGMGYITVSKGTPALNYAPNNIDLATQYIIRWIYVAPNATVGVDITPPPTIDTTNLQKIVTASYPIVSADNNYTIIFQPTAPITITVNNNLIDKFTCDFYNDSAFDVTFVAGTATLNMPDGTILEQDKVCALIKVMATNNYKLKGELV